MKENLIKEINKIFHEYEAGHYDVNHPEIIKGDFVWWNKFGNDFIKSAFGNTTCSVLDLGCGTGFVGSVLMKYLKKGDTLTSYDLSLNMLMKTKEKINESPVGIKKVFVSGDAENLPFQGESFDIIAVNAVMHHVPDYNLLLREVDRVLKKGGILAVSHEQSSDFFKSSVFRFMAMCYKIIGGGIKISDPMQEKVNRKLKEEGLIEKDLSKDEMMGLIDFHSPIEQESLFIDAQKGISPKKILSLFFKNYKLVELKEYSTFFHREFLEKNKFIQKFLKTLNCLILRNKGPLFAFIIKKRTD